MKTKKIILYALLTSMLNGCVAVREKGQITVTVSDLTPPVIEVKNRTIEEGQKLEVSDCCTVYDNMDVKPSVELKGDDKFDNDTPGTYTITITAEDSAGNTSEKSFTITVESKPEPTPTSTPEPTTVPLQNSNSNSSQSNNSNSNSSSSNQTTTTVPTPTPEPTAVPSSPVTKYFLFSDGYTMSNAGTACKAEFGNYGSGTKRCDVVMNDDGTYAGYVFTYNP